MSTAIRSTSVADGQAIYELVNTYARQGLMLPQSRSAVYQAIRDFVVADFGGASTSEAEALNRAEGEGQILGCGALQITWGDLGEIRSLAVANGWQGRGIGRQIVEVLLEKARQLDLPRVFALTYQRPFFLRLGFEPIEKDALPQKIWAGCVDCVKFPNCDEEAVITSLAVTCSGGRSVERSGASALQPSDHQTREAVIRKAKVADVEDMAQIINERAALDELLPRSQHHIYQNLRDFVVCERDGRILGTGAMHVLWSDLGEIRALAVGGPWQRQGIGTAIVQALLQEAHSLGLPRVFAFTYKPGFFERLGFHLVDKETLPRKVWGECIHCVRFPNCDEVALVLDLNADPQPK